MRQPSVSERVLVLVDDSPATPRALRRAAATAAILRAPLLARASSRRRRTRARRPSGQRRIREHLDDATDLGAEILIVEASDVVDGVVTVARARRVTRLVLPHRRVGRARAGAALDVGRADPRTAPDAGDHDRRRRPRDDRRLPQSDEATDPPNRVRRLVLAATPKYGLEGPVPDSYALPRSGPDHTPEYPRGP